MRRMMVAGLIVAAVLAVLLSPLASMMPDGLERVAENLGFIHKGEGAGALKAPIPDYAMPGLGRGAVATSVAGLAGVLLTFAAAYGLGRLIKRKRGG